MNHSTRKLAASAYAALQILSGCGQQADEQTLVKADSSPIVNETLFSANAQQCNKDGPGYFGCQEVAATLATPTLTTTADPYLGRTGRNVRVKYVFQCKTAAPVQGAFVDEQNRSYAISSTKTPEEKAIDYTTFSADAPLTLKIPAHVKQIDAGCALRVVYKLATPVIPVLSLYADIQSAHYNEVATLRSKLTNQSHWSLVSFGIDSALTRLKSDRSTLEVKAAAYPAGTDQRAVLDAKIRQLDKIIGDKNCDGEAICGLTKSLDGIKSSCEGADTSGCQSAVATTLTGMDGILAEVGAARGRLVAFLEAEIARLQQVAGDLWKEVDGVLKTVKQP